MCQADNPHDIGGGNRQTVGAFLETLLENGAIVFQNEAKNVVAEEDWGQIGQCHQV